MLGILPLVALAGLAVSHAGDECPDNSERVDITIGEEGTPVVSPESVTIFEDETKGPERVCWVASGLAANQRVSISGNTAEDDHLSAKQIDGSGSSVADSGRPTKTGTWYYTVTVTVVTPGGAVMSVDPEVIIKGKGG